MKATGQTMAPPPPPPVMEPEESPWEAKMRNGYAAPSARPTPAPAADDFESLWSAKASGKKPDISSKPVSSPFESSATPWDSLMKGRPKAGDSMSRSASLSNGEASDNAWGAPLRDDPRLLGSMSRSMSTSTVDSQDSWNAMLQAKPRGHTSKPVVSSPLAFHEPEVTPSPNRLISPTTVELEEDDHVEAGFDGLSADQQAQNIRDFYMAAADAEIEFRTQLFAPGVDNYRKAELMEEFRLGMEQYAREVWEGWKGLREKENERQRLVAEAAEKEKAKRPLWGAASKRSQTPVPSPAPAPLPTLNKKQAKKGGKKQVEVVPEPEPVISLAPTSSQESDDLPMGSDPRSRWAPASGGPTPRNMNMWSAGTPARSSSPAPPAPSSKNPFGAPQNTTWAAKKPSGLGKATVTDEEDEEDEGGMHERIAGERKAAEGLSEMTSPWKWMHGDAAAGSSSRSSTPKPDAQPRRSGQKGVPPANKTSGDPRFRTWMPGGGNGYGGEEEEDPQAMFEGAMRSLQGSWE